MAYEELPNGKIMYYPDPAPPPFRLPERPLCEFDTECAKNWWLIKFYAPDGRMYEYHLHPETGRTLNYGEIQWFIDNFTLVGFNCINYDKPMLRLAMAGAGVERLKQLNDLIITGGLKWWKCDEVFPEMIDLPTLDMIDIMEPTPGVKISLKTYMGRMHSPTVQELPFDHSQPIPLDMVPIAADYCGNDLFGTRQLRQTISKRLDLRIKLSNRYSVDVRSKSDAQMAEAIYKQRLGLPYGTGRYVPDGFTFKYTPPSFIRFVTPQLQTMFQTVLDADFIVRDKDEIPDEDSIGPDGKPIKTGVKIPKSVKGMVIPFDGTKYKLGIGGLHSQEKALTLRATEEVLIVAEDVASYYPNTLRILGQWPEQVGREWLEMYCNDIDERVKAKKLDPVLADGLKIFLNGIFGKLLNKHSAFFAPEMGIGVTMTGQLSLFMLIEALSRNGIRTVSANTDGITCMVPKHMMWLHQQTIEWWQRQTGYTMERKLYRSVHSASVNSYVAFDVDGAITRKGMFSASGVTGEGVPIAGAHPDRDIAIEAAIAYLQHGTPIHQTVRSCQDVTKFISLRGVKGGGTWRDQELAKVVRWYYSTNGAPILYKSNGNKVADSDGAMPAMVLPATLPADIDYATYENYAQKLLTMAGVQ